jgi:hypothetical protein
MIYSWTISHNTNDIKFEKKDGTINPNFVLVNELSKILYLIIDSIQKRVTTGVGGEFCGMDGNYVWLISIPKKLSIIQDCFLTPKWVLHLTKRLIKST